MTNDSQITNMSPYEQLMALANDLAGKAPIGRVSADQRRFITWLTRSWILE